MEIHEPCRRRYRRRTEAAAARGGLRRHGVWRRGLRQRGLQRVKRSRLNMHPPVACHRGAPRELRAETG